AGAAPPLLINLAGLASSVLVLIVPVAYAVERLIKRDGLRIADATCTATGGVRRSAPRSAALTRSGQAPGAAAVGMAVLRVGDGVGVVGMPCLRMRVVHG
ncbi:hypothetical protein, partial [Streptomyces noursei]|uniref:hypothetical protein n=1 Tax=Streptomyces noursei TaxID=1971 RepID=UPI0021553806